MWSKIGLPNWMSHDQEFQRPKDESSCVQRSYFIIETRQKQRCHMFTLTYLCRYPCNRCSNPSAAGSTRRRSTPENVCPYQRRSCGVRSPCTSRFCLYSTTVAPSNLPRPGWSERQRPKQQWLLQHELPSSGPFWRKKIRNLKCFFARLVSCLRARN